MMDVARYWIALGLVAVAPGVYLYWFLIHPFIGFWRRFDSVFANAAANLGILALAGVIVAFRRTLLSVEFGTHPTVIALAAVLLASSLALRIAIGRKFSSADLLGMPELDPAGHPPRLVTDGIYSRIRHPRYVQLVVAFFGYATMSNYLAAYMVATLGILWAAVLARVEERELVDRFGDEYELYRERVPRFFPRL